MVPAESHRQNQAADCRAHLLTESETPERDWIAVLCAISAVSIWGWWMSATRIAAQQGVAPIDVALLRYIVPAILLIPVLPAALRKLKQSPLWATIALLGWGAPFLWLVTASLQTANVVYLATIVPCTMPLFAVAAERLVFGRKLSAQQLAGFSLIAAAATLVVLSALIGSGGITLYSLMLMLLAAVGWACYVIAFRHTGLSAAEGAAWVCAASTVLIIMIKIFTGNIMLSMTTEQLLFNTFSQGFLSGFVAVLLYTTAITRIGSARAASFSVLMPVIASLFAWLWLGETPAMLSLVALALGSAGVAVVNGVFRRKPVQ